MCLLTCWLYNSHMCSINDSIDPWKTSCLEDLACDVLRLLLIWERDVLRENITFKCDIAWNGGNKSRAERELDNYKKICNLGKILSVAGRDIQC
jgi:hypothetical protein